MVFSSLSFIYIFLPLTLIAFFVTPKRKRYIPLLIFSILFYAWGDFKNLWLMLLVGLINWLFARLTVKFNTHKKPLCLTAVIITLILLLYFKYTALIVDIFSLNITPPALPIGISFYSFQAISYTLDVLKGEHPPAKNPLYFLCYLTLFPQLIAGPIVRYTDVKNSLVSPSPSLSFFGSGCRRFVCGLCKKVLIANQLGYYFTQLTNAGFGSTAGALTAIFAYTLQIYYDFSGYSDMAIGLGRMFGLSFCENFNYPYISRSITEFWRRWHMSLSSWFRDYLYIPLGGSRRGTARTILNLFIVWLLTGLWHGASLNFAAWGIYYFILLTLEKLVLGRFLKAHRPFAHFYTITAVVFGWALFAFESLGELKTFLLALINVKAPLSAAAPFIPGALVVIAIGACGSLPWPRRLCHRRFKKLIPVFIALGLLLSTAFIASGSYNPFLYFRF